MGQVIKSLAAVLSHVVFFSAIGLGGESSTTVTTYIIKTQEEREKTRFTLTEWLRIKERMKMMDLWLAMFSDPKKDRFRPELSVAYTLSQGSISLSDSSLGNDTANVRGSTAKAQLWLTNILSGVVGVRTLNIDLGMEGVERRLTSYTLNDRPVTSDDPPVESVPASARAFRRNYYTGNLRIFGGNIQDSSLVLKYGKYQSTNSSAGDDPSDSVATKYQDTVAGAELQLYLFKVMGGEANYLAFGKEAASASGRYFDYAGFLEISFIRLLAGAYQESWTLRGDLRKVETEERGYFAGAKLQF